MRLPNTYFTKINGGLTPIPESQDPISGFLFFNNIIPATWSTNSTGDCVWATAIAYVAGDIVYEGTTNKKFYICKTSHTSGTFATDLSGGKWELKPGENIKLVRRMLDVEDLGILKDSVNHSVEYYQISEFFRLNPNGYLYINISPVPVTYTFSELYTFQKELNGILRLVSIFNTIDFATTEVTTLQGIATTLANEYMPLSILYTADFTTVTDIDNLVTLRSLNAPKVSVVFGMDGSGEGYKLFVTKGYSIGSIGAVMGAVSKLNVADSAASPELIDFASSELDLPLLCNGQRVKDISTTDLEDLYAKGYLFFNKQNGEIGTYLVDTLTCTNSDDDYYDIQRNRTMDKAIREVRKVLFPKLHAKIKTTTGGRMDALEIDTFKDITGAPLAQMISNNEISNYVVNIDPKQDVLRTSTLQIEVSIQPYATARWIDINIGFSILS